MSTTRYDMQARNIHTDSAKAKLLYVSKAKYGGDWFSALHTHKCAELFYVIGGKGQFLVRDDSFTISAGDMVIVNPSVEHTETSLEANPLEYIVMGIDGLVLSMDDTDDDTYCIINFLDDTNDIQFCLKSMLIEIENKETGFETVCQDLLDILLIKLLRRTNFSKVLASNKENHSPNTVAVRRYIEGHFRESLTLDSIAESVHMNKFHLAHRFRKEFGMSPINYMIHLRIQESKELLTTTNYSLGQIARTCGFASSSYFSQRFRAAEGMSPVEFRKQSKRENSNSETDQNMEV